LVRKFQKKIKQTVENENGYFFGTFELLNPQPPAAVEQLLSAAGAGTLDCASGGLCGSGNIYPPRLLLSRRVEFEFLEHRKVKEEQYFG